jgi:DNA-binding LacI/PurR family transcriptional regulator
MQAHGLKTGRSNSVAFLLTEPQHLLFEDPTLSLLLRDCAQELGRREIPLLLMVAGTPDERRRITSYVSAGHVDGVLLTSRHVGGPMVTELLHNGVPMVASGEPVGYESRMGYVAADDVGGARAMVRHLSDLGRVRIAMITGPLDTSGGVLRLKGYRRELGEHYDESLVVVGDYTRAGGGRAMRELLDRRPDLDAVFVASDLMAAGALTSLAAAGRTVPDDVSVGGFDDSGLAETLDPPLTTMRQPFERIAHEMVRLLLEVVEGREIAAITLPTTLVQRESKSPLNPPSRLNFKLAALLEAVQLADAAPTQGQIAVFHDLEERVERHLDELHQVLQGKLSELIGMMSSASIQPIAPLA